MARSTKLFSKYATPIAQEDPVASVTRLLFLAQESQKTDERCLYRGASLRVNVNLTPYYAATVIVCGCLCTAIDVRAQSDPALALQTITEESTFHVGERIPLELRFTSDSVKRYEINLARYDRSGRMHSEHFDVSPITGGGQILSQPTLPMDTPAVE